MSLPGPQPSAQSTGALGEPFVGRAPELARLEGLLDNAVQGFGSLILMTGEAGIGKTALAGEFLRRSRARDPSLALIRGRCVEHYGTGAAYLPFLDGCGTLLLGRSRELTAKMLRSYAPSWCLQLPALAATPEAREALKRETVGATKERMLREMGDVFEATAATAVMVGLLEDVQWADPSSADLVRHLASRMARQRLLLIVTLRPAELEASDHPMRGFIHDLRAHSGCHEMALGSLDEAGVAAYLDARFPGHRFPARLAGVIQRRSEGHPLFVTSFAQFLLEHGDIAGPEGAWALKEGVLEGSFEAPASVRGIIRGKLEALDEPDRSALQLASVMGREFLSTVLARLLGVDELALEERLHGLDRVRRLIDTLREEELPDGALATRYRFANALYQDVLYDDLVSKRRMLLHKQVAEELVRHYGAQAPRLAAPLALHFERAREFGSAITYLGHAGDNAARLYANGEAADYYLRAVRLVEKLPPGEGAEHLVRLHEKLAAVNLAMGSFDAAVLSYSRMLEGARAAAAPAQECAALGGLCRALFFACRMLEMAVRAEEALRAAERSGSERLYIESLLPVALILQDAGDLTQCRSLLDETAASARRLAAAPTLMQALAYRGIVHYWQSQYAQAERRLAEALPLAEELRDGFQVSVCLMFLSLCRGNLGRISEALATLEQGSAMARRNGDRYWLPRMINTSGWLHRELQDFEGAMARDREGLELAREAGAAEAEGGAFLNLALDHIYAGQPDAAAPALEQAQAASSRDQWFRWWFGIRLEAAQAELHLARGSHAAAELSATRLLDAATRHETRTYVVSAHTMLAEVERARGAPERAAEHLAEALQALDCHAAPLIGWKTYAALARLRAGVGDAAAAEAARAEAAAIVQRIATGVQDEALRSTFLASPGVRPVLAGPAAGAS